VLIEINSLRVQKRMSCASPGQQRAAIRLIGETPRHAAENPFAAECGGDHTAAELQLLSLRLLLAVVADAELTADESPTLFRLDPTPLIPPMACERGSTFKALACHRASWYPLAPPGNEGQK
jgi:hypothetical protein